MEIIKLREEFIKLGQALKAAGLVEWKQKRSFRKGLSWSTEKLTHAAEENYMPAIR